MLRAVIEGLGSSFQSHLDPQFMEMIYMLLEHTNRFVRETGYSLCKAIIEISDSATLDNISHRMAQYLSVGLSDQWGHVTLSCAQACRTFMLNLKSKSPSLLESVYVDMIPALCFMRYSIADGLRNYSIETWRLVVEDKGKDFLVRYLGDSIELYKAYITSDNAALRETASLCISELFSKIGKPFTDPFEDELVKLITQCLNDKNWPVREAACVALQSYFENYTLDPMFQDDIQRQLLVTLSDEFLAVREHSALSLAALARANPDSKDSLLTILKDYILAVESQEQDAHIDSDHEDFFGPLAKEARDNDPQLHSNQEIFCCECHLHHLNNCHVHKQVEPWRKSDGALYLIKEILSLWPDLTEEFVTLILEASQVKPTFAHYDTLIQTVLKTLSQILKNSKDTLTFNKLMEEISSVMFSILNNEHLSFLTKANFKEFIYALMACKGEVKFVDFVDKERCELLKLRLGIDIA